MCGIIGISNHDEAARVAFWGLYALQHRGEESAGIVSFDGKKAHAIKNMGLVSDTFSEKSLDTLKGKCAIGHTRYSTMGSNNIKNVQPFWVTHKSRPIAVAHNGNLTNTEKLYRELEEEGAIFQTTMDSEIVIHLLARSKGEDMKDRFSRVLSALEGAFSLIFLVGDMVVGARDPQGFRPLCLGKINGSYILASESCALDLSRAEFVREIEPGEIVFIRGEDIESFRFAPRASKSAQCIFENIYFSRPDSHIFDDNVYLVRKRLGARLAQEHPVKDADFVMSFPDSGSYAGIGYAQELNLPFEIGIIRNHYIGRTFIQPTQLARDAGVRVKLNPIRELLKGKKVVVVDDSIVRGTTSRNRIAELRRVGVKEIHLRISCPPIQSPCFYGVDFPSKKELIAASKSVEEIAQYIEVDSLGYLSLEGMLSCMKHPKDFCSACFTGEYPVNIPENKSKYLLEV
ncbi:MAG TPA: amidophosphoribosyltransferase [Candidatus Omnitrophota bacterium]|jgi:amidophosphoribosyltransferase|nr:amidophosphoribosyltransferase [Candidatus Omnitrophota bacterium]HPN56883.1 amidophosphoribosyltransferase [Candidatus Omnitrophota bacterium]